MAGTKKTYTRPSNLYEDEEVKIPPKVELIRDGLKDLRSYRVLSVSNPGEIYLIEDLPAVNWVEDMQKFYGQQSKENSVSLDLQQLFKIDGTRVYKNRYYVWNDKKNQWWYRVLVEKPEVGGAMVMVLLVDINERRYVSIKDFMEIHPRFSGHAALGGLYADLVDIRQPGNGDTWTANSSAYLKQLCTFDKVFYGVIVGQDKNKFGLILSEKRSNALPQHTLQWMMVEKGLADCFGFGAGRHDLVHIITGTPSYNQQSMKKTLTSVELSSFSKAKMTNHRSISSLYRGPVHGSLDRSQSMEINGRWTSPKKQSDGHVPLSFKMQRNVALVVVTEVVPGGGPSTFYLQMRHKCPILEDMMQDLERVVQDLEPLTFQKVQAGDIMAAQVTDEKDVFHWARVVIKSVQDSSVDVILIDFGIEKVDVPMTNLRNLSKYFRQVVPFCQRAHMDVIIEKSAASQQKNEQVLSGWTEELARMFRQYIQSWMTTDPLYYAWQPRGQRKEGLVQLEQFNQDLRYDLKSGQWCPDTPQVNSPYAAINEKKDDPLLRQFFTSVGVDMVYEVTTDKDQPYHFEPIWDCCEGQVDITTPHLSPVSK